MLLARSSRRGERSESAEGLPPAARRRARRGPPGAGDPLVLAYHAIHAEEAGIDAPDVITSPAVLEGHIQILLRSGYRFLTADQLAIETGGRRAPRGSALVTFDDGWLDGLTVAAPLPARLGIPATFFLCPGLWGGYDARMGGPAAW